MKATAGLGSNYFYHYEGSLTNAVGAMYAKEHFKAAAKEVTDEMVFNIRKEFKEMLDKLDWMDEKTKQRAFEKADLMTPNIAYAKEILDDRLLEDFYDGLVISKASYLKNYLQLKIWISKYYANELRKPKDPKSWKTHGGAAIVNAFYNPAENSINFPAGILDGVFFQGETHKCKCINTHKCKYIKTHKCEYLNNTIQLIHKHNVVFPPRGPPSLHELRGHRFCGGA